MREKLKFVWEAVCYAFSGLSKALKPVMMRLCDLREKLSAAYYKKTELHLTLHGRLREQIISGKLLLVARIFLIFFMIAQAFAVYYVIPRMNVLIAMLILYLPLSILVIRGYRLALLLVIPISFYIMVRYQLQNYVTITVGSSCTLLLLLLGYFNFKLENTKSLLQRQGLLPKPEGTFWRDFAFSLLLFGILNVYTTLYNNMQEKAHKEALEQAHKKLMEAAGYVVYHQRAYSDYCKKEGWQVKLYPQAFNDKFAAEVKNIEIKLSEQQTSLKKIYDNARGTNWSKTLRQVVEEINNIREDAIIRRFAKELKLPVAEVRMTSEMDDTMTMKEACKLFDEEHDKYLAADRPEFGVISMFK